MAFRAAVCFLDTERLGAVVAGAALFPFLHFLHGHLGSTFFHFEHGWMAVVAFVDFVLVPVEYDFACAAAFKFQLLSGPDSKC